jgi:hypothetical protein
MWHVALTPPLRASVPRCAGYGDTTEVSNERVLLLLHSLEAHARQQFGDAAGAWHER